MSNNDLPEEELLEYEIRREAHTISIIKKNPLPKEHDKNDAVGRYLRRRTHVRSGRAVFKSNTLKRAFAKALDKNYKKRETSDDAKHYYWKRKWQYAIKHVRKAVKALRVIRSIKGGEFTTESLEPNLLRQMVSEFSYSTWAATYARQQKLNISNDQQIVNINLINKAVQEERHHESNFNVGFEFNNLQIPEMYKTIIETAPSERTDLQLLYLADFLKTYAYFEGMPKEIILQFASVVHMVRKPSGVPMYKAGDKAENFYIVLAGKLMIMIQQMNIDFVVAQIEEGGQFGEHDLVQHWHHENDNIEEKDCITVEVKEDNDDVKGNNANDDKDIPNQTEVPSAKPIDKKNESKSIKKADGISEATTVENLINEEKITGNNQKEEKKVIEKEASLEQQKEEIVSENTEEKTNDSTKNTDGNNDDNNNKLIEIGEQNSNAIENGTVNDAEAKHVINQEVEEEEEVEEESFTVRTHDIVTLTPVFCLRISKAEYFPIYRDVLKRDLSKKIATLKSMPLFNLCTKKEILVLAEHAEIRRYKEQAIIAKEGHLAQFLYIVCDGDCRALMKVKNDAKTIKASGRRARRNLLIEIQELGEGMTFGETVLFNEKPRRDKHGRKKYVPRLRYPGSLVSNAYAEIMVIPRKIFYEGGKTRIISEHAVGLIKATARQTKMLYEKSIIEKKMHQDNKWRRKKAKVLLPLLSDTQLKLMKKNDEFNQGYKM